MVKGQMINKFLLYLRGKRELISYIFLPLAFCILVPVNRNLVSTSGWAENFIDAGFSLFYYYIVIVFLLRKTRIRPLVIGLISFAFTLIHISIVPTSNPPFQRIIHLLAFIVILILQIVFSQVNDDSIRVSIKNIIKEAESRIEAVINLKLEKSLAMAIETSIPKGEDDKNYGFDYVPFMLKTIQERRERFTKSANNFLKVTITLGVIFAAIVLAFGYFLLNETSAGLPRTLTKLEENTKNIRPRLDGIRVDTFQADNFSLVRNNYNQFITFHTEQPSVKDIQSKVGQAYNNKDLPALSNTVKSGLELLKGDVYLEGITRLRSLDQSIDAFLRDKENQVLLLNDEIRDIDSLLKNTDKTISESSYRIPDLIKRLAIGVVVSTFFFAILKYTGGLYKEHYRQVLIAENAELTLRKFYVAYKCAGNDEQSKRNVINSLIASDGSLFSADITEDNDIKNLGEKAIDAISAIGKKG